MQLNFALREAAHLALSDGSSSVFKASKLAATACSASEGMWELWKPLILELHRQKAKKADFTTPPSLPPNNSSVPSNHRLMLRQAANEEEKLVPSLPRLRTEAWPSCPGRGALMAKHNKANSLENHLPLELFSLFSSDSRHSSPSAEEINSPDGWG